MKNKLIQITTTSLTCLALASCSLFSSSTQLVTIETSNPAADIRINGQRLGKGTVTTQLKKNKSHAITADCGNQHGMALIDSNLSVTGALDIIGGVCFLIPFLGFISPGAWTLSPDYVRIDMQ